MDSKSAFIPPSIALSSQLRLLVAVIAILSYGVFGLGAVISITPAQAAADIPHHSKYRSILEKHQRGDLQALRIREDRERGRLWVLTLDHIYVYDSKNLLLIRRIGLPNWSVVSSDFACPSDMVLDKSGNAFVSNNVQPRLLRVDFASFKTEDYQLQLISDKQWEIGFGALAFGHDGSLFADSAIAGALFRIDLATRTAKEMASSERLAEACTGPECCLSFSERQGRLQ